MSARSSFYITTPIYYVNAAPHLGTAYCTLLADVAARYQRIMGVDTMFLTGLDEHGEKIAEIAEANGMTPQEWCDNIAPQFKDLWSQLNISYDDFIRTTEPRQHRAVTELWNKMKDLGYLYKGYYDGWYCVPDESYFTDTQVEKADEARHTHGQHLCPDCDRPLKRVQEESWFFKLSDFQQRLLDYFDAHPDCIKPAHRMNEVRSFVEHNLQDLSVSRTTFDWGIRVPFDEKHVTYVWFDALLNYMTAIGYGEHTPQADAEFAKRWPATVHLVGKDIIRFHCIIWPAILMALGLELPEQIFAHGFLTVRNHETGKVEKMSKSRGNVIAPQEILEQLGCDGYRYYFMTNVSHGDDSPISREHMVQVYNADLANTWGNLVSRSLNMALKYFGNAPVLTGESVLENPLREVAERIAEQYHPAMESFAYPQAKDAVFELISAANLYVEQTAPWNVAKDESRCAELAEIMYNLLEAIRISAWYLLPFMPETSREVLQRLHADTTDTQTLEEATQWGQLTQGTDLTKGDALFPRIEVA